VASLWATIAPTYRSRWSALARSFFLARNHARQQLRQRNRQLRELRDQLQHTQTRLELAEAQNRQLHEQLRVRDTPPPQPQPITLPIGDTLPHQQFGVGLIVLCVNLARTIGLRPTVAALEIVFAWLGVTQRVPTYQTIRDWMQRLGLDRLQNAAKTKNGVWLADHSNQIGADKVLAVLRVQDSWQPGSALRHSDVELLTVQPGPSWKRDDVAKAYQATAKRCGVPRAVATDGAVELREPVETLGKSGKKPVSLRDPKHVLANRLEALLTRDERWEKFTQQLGRTRSAVQQTELAHFTPPSFKAKARFMNLAPILKWASTVLWHLSHSESRSRAGVSEARLDDKLGWLREFASAVSEWQACQEVVSATLELVNAEGLVRGITERVRERASELASSVMSQELVSQVVEYLGEHEKKLRRGERLPMSTEIVESVFGKFKQREGQHAKGGFTSLLLTLPVVLRATTAEEVRSSFARVKVADVTKWKQEYLPQTLTAKRQLLFREAKPATQPRATEKTAAK
jgi:hypothetical protein